MNIIFAGLGIIIGIALFALYILVLEQSVKTPAVLLICAVTSALAIIGFVNHPGYYTFLTILGMNGVILILHTIVLIKRRVTIVDCTTPLVAEPHKVPDASVNRTV